MNAVTLALLLIVCWVAAFAAEAEKAAQRPRSFASMQAELEPSKVVVYKTVGDRKLELHFFFPPDFCTGDQRPAFVAIHGGGWRSGTPRRFYPYANALVSKGYVGVSVGYRLLSAKQGTTVFDCAKDARSAIRYLRAHAKELGIDPSRITVAGGSAGGHVAAGTALFDGIDDPNDNKSVSCLPNALVLLFAVLDTSPEGYGNAVIGPQWKSISPVHQIKPGCPPTLIFHGGKDNVTSLATVERYKQLMTRNGNLCELVIEPQGVHGHLNADMKLFDQAVSRIEAFLDRLNLGVKKTSPDSSETGATRPAAGFAKLPGTKIAFMSNTPGPARRANVEKLKKANQLIKDRLQLNREGYKLWTLIVGPHLLVEK